jgi:phosphate:Na+ symporter
MNTVITTGGTILGGVGILLLGMVLMTDGLKALGGNTLRRVLGRMTSNRATAVISGTGITALIQNSSATILATVGLVGAGLLGFSQAIGVIIGANIGSTSTGWIVALVGFKFNIKIITLPLIAVGALMKLLSDGRKASLGIVISGFGLIFVGIGILQEGMQYLSQYIHLAGYGVDTLWDKLLLVGIGIIMTVVLQSSSVAVVMTLAALNAHTISLDQSALLVVGQNMGKVFYGVLAAVGATVPAKRSAYIHIFFNVITGIVVFPMVDSFTALTADMCRVCGSSDPAILLCAFHTGFNLLGMILILPFTGNLTRVLENIVHEKLPYLTRNLDYSIADIPPVALDAARAAIVGIAAHILSSMKDLVLAEIPYHVILKKIDEADDALRYTNQFLAHVRSNPEFAIEHEKHITILHSTEHLTRLAEACREAETVRTTAHTPYLRQLALDQLASIESSILWLKGECAEAPTESVQQISLMFAEIRKKMRTEMIDKIASGEENPDTAFKLLEAMRWIDRLAYHVWRAILHLSAFRSGKSSDIKDFIGENPI